MVAPYERPESGPPALTERRVHLIYDSTGLSDGRIHGIHLETCQEWMFRGLWRGTERRVLESRHSVPLYDTAYTVRYSIYGSVSLYDTAYTKGRNQDHPPSPRGGCGGRGDDPRRLGAPLPPPSASGTAPPPHPVKSLRSSYTGLYPQTPPSPAACVRKHTHGCVGHAWVW